MNKGRGLWNNYKQRLLERLSDHVSGCPRCQRRMAMVNRVELGLMLMKTQPLDIELLSQANNRTLDVLKHALRYAPKSVSLRNARSDTRRFEKMRPGLERVLNAAACLFIVIMIRSGVSNSLLDCKNQGQTAFENYYARNLDSQTYDEIFPTDI
ncbi:MAG: hypothetical protein KAS23_02485 [Anaerohalosphaera sp.]|nr:hypothetical protein [Anaerohalosphaera sp.]